jgi:hypothetical protein
MRTAPQLPLPTPADYERAMLEQDGAYVVAGRFYRDHDRAALERRRLAQRWAEEDQRRWNASTYIVAYTQ